MKIVVVSGAVANKFRKGGEAWVRLSFVLGLKRLGFRVFFVEEIERETCVDAAGAVVPFENSVNLAYFRRVMEEFGLAGSAVLVYERGERIHGMGWPELLELAESADLLVNFGGHLSCPELFTRFRRKAYMDVDPGFTQFWHAAGNSGARLANHDCYFTIGANIGTAVCSIPTGDIPWRHTRPPVVLEQWPASIDPSVDGGPLTFTTVASWRGPFGPIQTGGKTYGLKVHEFRKFIELPRRKKQAFEIALDIHPADQKDLDALRQNGWHISDPGDAAGDPGAFRRFVQNSGAEFSVAQGIYVETNSGWFSDRTVHYLACGRPALVQDTGFSKNLPVGEGLVPFRNLDEAISGAAGIQRDYQKHCRAARWLAETYFDSDKILSQLVYEAGLTP